jgi:acyl-coenzyme A thioesterase PaaI-like protein
MMNHRLFKLLLNCYPPYWATGIVIRSVSPDFRRLTVRMKMHWYNRNYVGTHFGGSLYAMTDPFYMLMLLQILSKAYLVWDQSARIDFIKPGKGTVTAEFEVTQALLDTIAENTTEGRKYLPELSVRITDETGELVALVTKTIYVRQKRKVER